MRALGTPPPIHTDVAQSDLADEAGCIWDMHLDGWPLSARYPAPPPLLFTATACPDWFGNARPSIGVSLPAHSPPYYGFAVTPENMPEERASDSGWPWESHQAS